MLPSLRGQHLFSTYQLITHKWRGLSANFSLMKISRAWLGINFSLINFYLNPISWIFITLKKSTNSLLLTGTLSKKYHFNSKEPLLSYHQNYEDKSRLQQRQQHSSAQIREGVVVVAAWLPAFCFASKLSSVVRLEAAATGTGKLRVAGVASNPLLLKKLRVN